MAKRLTHALSIPLLALCIALPACGTGRRQQTNSPQLQAPAELRSLDDYALARNAYALLELDDPERGPLRARLQVFLIDYIDEALGHDELERAVEALEQAVGMWTPTELRSLQPSPELAAAARRIYERVAKVGDEPAAALALFVEQAFGDAEQRGRAEQSFAQLHDWIERGQSFSPDPTFFDELERLLEHVSGVLPSPWLVDTLGDAYLERYRRAQQSASRLGQSDPRAAFTAYLLTRLYLRADRLEDLLPMLERITLDELAKALRDQIADASAAEARSPGDLDQLIAEFTPSP